MSFLTDLTPSVSQANFVNFKFSSGCINFSSNKYSPSNTLDFENKYLFTNQIILAAKFFCIIPSSIWVPQCPWI